MYGFRWKDWADYKTGPVAQEVSYEDQSIGYGDGETAVFQLSKTYRSGVHSYRRPITKPVIGTVRAGVEQDELQEGVHYSVDDATGLITFDVPPDPGMEVFAGFEFDVPVRFDTDRILTSVANFQAGQVPNVPVIEVRV